MPSARRGEVWLVDLGMTAKVWPALVVSIPAEDRDRALLTLVPHTTSPRQSRFEAARVGVGARARRDLCLEGEFRGYGGGQDEASDPCGLCSYKIIYSGI